MTRARRTHRAALTLALALGLPLTLLAPPTFAARPDLARQERSVRALLDSYEYRPTRAVLDRIGPDVEKILIRLASHPKVRPTVRVRATETLGLYPTRDAGGFLRSLLQEPSLSGTPTGRLLRRAAMSALALAFGPAAVPDIAPLREDADPQIREGCARALGATGAATAKPILDAWLPHEPELFVRTAIDAALSTLRRHRR